jgi:hypothetical protein
MKVQEASNAKIDQEKVVHYLLNSAHPDNGGKADYFEKLGFTRRNWASLGDAMRKIVLVNDVTIEISSPYGKKYVVDGEIIGPNGVSSRIRTVWIREPGTSGPRLVTAYPAGWKGKS